MTFDPTFAELLGALVVLGGLGFSSWALIDDAFDLLNVWRFGEVNGPRWVAATGHLLFNLTLLVGWLCFCGVIAVAIYLPSRTDMPAAELSLIVGWLRVAFACTVLVGQVHQRNARFKLRRLPLEAWERMILTMYDGLGVEDRAALSRRLFRATAAGREIGHAVANDLQRPVAVLDEIARDDRADPEIRQMATDALADIDSVIRHTSALHAEIRLLEDHR
jgi:hypothetical protein